MNKTAPPVFRPRLWAMNGTIMVAITLCSGCTLGPDFKQPASPPLKSLSTPAQAERIAAASAATGAAQTLVAEKDIPGLWWTLFRSPELTKLIQRAIAHSPDLKSAQAALMEANENAIAKQGSLLPALDATMSANRQKTSGAMFGNPNFSGSVFSLYNASVKVSYTFDVFGAIHRQIEGYEAQAEYQKYQLEAAFLTLASNIVTTVIQEAALHALIDATEAIIAAQREQLTVIQQQFELGSVSNAPVLAQQAAIEQTRTSIPPLQKQLAHAQHRLAVLVGDLPHSGTETRFTLTDLHLPEQLPLSLPAKLLEQRPDVQAQAAALHAASAQIGVVAASIFPDFTISANVSSIATNAGDLFLPDSLIWGLGANLLQPIFHGGEFTHKKRAAVAAYEQAAAHYHSTVLQAFQNVADSLSALEFDTDELNAQDAAERASYASLELTRSQFQMGAVSYITLLSAQRDYQQIKIGQIKAQALRYADTAALFQALGGGWWNRDIFSTAVSTTKAKTTP